MEEIFTLNGVCPFTCHDNKRNQLYCCGGKVSVQELSSGREGIGILLEISESITIQKPRYIVEDGTWDYNHSVNHLNKITQYDPIRIRIIKTGNCSLVMNRFILGVDDSDNTTIIIP